MALMSDLDIPLSALRLQIASAVDVIVQMARLADGSRRVTYVTEVLELGAQGGYGLRSLYELGSHGSAVDDAS
jgi:pilus assembly protein CpaF